MTFKELRIGQTFDFVSPDRLYNLFHDRCVKISARRYRSLNSGLLFTVGTVKCRVFNAGELHETI